MWRPSERKKAPGWARRDTAIDWRSQLPDDVRRKEVGVLDREAGGWLAKNSEARSWPKKGSTLFRPINRTRRARADALYEFMKKTHGDEWQRQVEEAQKLGSAPAHGDPRKRKAKPMNVVREGQHVTCYPPRNEDEEHARMPALDADMYDFFYDKSGPMLFASTAEVRTYVMRDGGIHWPRYRKEMGFPEDFQFKHLHLDHVHPHTCGGSCSLWNYVFVQVRTPPALLPHSHSSLTTTTAAKLPHAPRLAAEVNESWGEYTSAEKRCRAGGSKAEQGPMIDGGRACGIESTRSATLPQPPCPPPLLPLRLWVGETCYLMSKVHQSFIYEAGALALKMGAVVDIGKALTVQRS